VRCHADIDLSGCRNGRSRSQSSGGQRQYRKRHEGRQLKGKDFFDAQNDPLITFHPTKVTQGIMAFDRKDYGMNKGIPFVTIADHVEVDVDLHGKRISAPVVFK
jgi:hypothetical protein